MKYDFNSMTNEQIAAILEEEDLTLEETRAAIDATDSWDALPEGVHADYCNNYDITLDDFEDYDSAYIAVDRVIRGMDPDLSTMIELRRMLDVTDLMDRCGSEIDPSDLFRQYYDWQIMDEDEFSAKYDDEDIERFDDLMQQADEFIRQQHEADLARWAKEAEEQQASK